jgi:predicted extracellular nuclease
MKNKYGFGLGALVVVMCYSCASVKPSGSSVSEEAIVAFYNVENLFDTINDPLTLDEDFAPTGKLQWNAPRYREKLSRISEVIDMLPGDLPVFVGLCEIENKAVLLDLVREPVLNASPKKGRYEIIHADSPDERGIDAAALYDASKLKDVKFEYYTIALPDPKDPNTRDILHVQGKMDGETIHFFVNHWPSRSGGQSESEPNRLAVAQLLKTKVDAVLAENANAKIVIMGDFNDHPNDKSVYEVLGAKEELASTLYNHMYSIHALGNGSYFYKGEWGALDQMITSRGLMLATEGNTKTSGWYVDGQSAGVMREEKLLFRDKEGIARPSRSYAGDSYKGGYSDHLPVFIKLQK